MWCGLRLRNGFEMDGDGMIRRVRPQLFNAAYPRMIVPEVRPGDRVRLRGVWEAGPLEFAVPETSPTMRLQLGTYVAERPLAIDQLGVEPDRRRAFVAYRYPFRYVFRPLERRSCRLDVSDRPVAVGRAGP